MIIKPKTRGFICTTAHPQGCAQMVQEQIDYVKAQDKLEGPKKVLVLGASTGFGLASRITAAFGAGADTLGISFEKEASEKRTATAGWYNTAAFEEKAREAGLFAESIIGDAFSDEIKQQAIARIKEKLGKIDLVIYSLAAPKRLDPKSGELYSSVLKPIGSTYQNKTVDFHSGEVSEVTIEPAVEDEIRQTVAVMGGEDWSLWIQALDQAGVLAEHVKTVAYSYIGPELTYPIYRKGTIGRAKDDLEETARQMNEKLAEKYNGSAYVSVNKALVTQSSSAIPVVPLYISLLFKVMKEKGLHEGCIEQMYRLFHDHLYSGQKLKPDEQGRIRIDNLEMREDVQGHVKRYWDEINTSNIEALTDLEGYRKDFFKLFGFGYAEVDYEREVDQQVDLK